MLASGSPGDKSCLGDKRGAKRWGSDRRGVLALGSAAMMARGAHAASGKNFVTANNSGYDTLDPHVVFDIGRIGVAAEHV